MMKVRILIFAMMRMSFSCHKVFAISHKATRIAISLSLSPSRRNHVILKFGITAHQTGLPNHSIADASSATLIPWWISRGGKRAVTCQCEQPACAIRNSDLRIHARNFARHFSLCSGAVANSLVSSCEDGVCRIYTESRLPSSEPDSRPPPEESEGPTITQPRGSRGRLLSYLSRCVFTSFDLR